MKNYVIAAALFAAFIGAVGLAEWMSPEYGEWEGFGTRADAHEIGLIDWSVGVLSYEHGLYDDAELRFCRVLYLFPGHSGAREYLKKIDDNAIKCDIFWKTDYKPWVHEKYLRQEEAG